MHNIILCGGSGTRLWPISKAALPKQFIKLFQNLSLFQMTLQRNMDICNGFIIVTSKDQYPMAKEQAEELWKLSSVDYPPFYFLLEPIFVYNRIVDIFENNLFRRALLVGIVLYYLSVLIVWLSFGKHADAWIPYKFALFEIFKQ